MVSTDAARVAVRVCTRRTHCGGMYAGLAGLKLETRWWAAGKPGSEQCANPPPMREDSAVA
eukprot:2930534-Pyramimonas_sp.AAC.1